MNKADASEIIKIIYDSLQNDNQKEIEELKINLQKRDFITKNLIQAIIPVIKSSSFSLEILKDITPYEVVRFLKEINNRNVIKQSIDDKFIDEIIDLMNK